MNSDLLDVLRSIAKRRESESSYNDESVDNNYGLGEKPNHIVETPLHEKASHIPEETPTPPRGDSSASGIEDFCQIKNGNRVRKNEINEKTQSRIGIPEEWSEGISRLRLTSLPAGVPASRWRRFIADARCLVKNGILSLAAAAGWTAYDLFGCDCDKPFQRVDQLGLAWLVNGGRVIGLSMNDAVIQTESGARL